MARLGAISKVFDPLPEQFSPDRHEAAPKPKVSAPRPSPPRAVATPCVQVCIVDGPSALCLGCYRTLAEIGGWSAFSDEERAAIMAALPTRADRIEPGKLAMPGGLGNLP